ncbi:alpha/beta fold hydrolase [Streptomyces sp. NPDC003077]|uniref:alpha/beta fold hydrolase n=1 Tax=Streptomyces sp. NPDC003077 TaxID=3154443 RepID=UPI0033A046A7
MFPFPTPTLPIRRPERAGHRVTVQGHSTLYFEAGQGPAVLLIHGNTATPRTWWRTMHDLSTTHRVIALALPGYGDTSPLEEPEHHAMVSFITAFLDELEVECVAVVGDSLGGLYAGELALAHPHRVSRLVLIDSAGLGRAMNPLLIAEALIPPPIGEALVNLLSLPGWDIGRVLTYALITRQPWRVRCHIWATQLRMSHSRTFLRTSLRAVQLNGGPMGQRHVLTGRLPDIRVPTLIIWGLTDFEFPVYQAFLAARRLPDGRVVVIPGAGHGSVLDCHEEIMDALGPFIRDWHRQDGPAPTDEEGDAAA